MIEKMLLAQSLLTDERIPSLRIVPYEAPKNTKEEDYSTRKPLTKRQKRRLNKKRK